MPLPQPVLFALSLGMMYAIAAVGLDVFAGYAGQFSFGNFGFVAIGAYTSAVLFNELHWGVWSTLPASIVVASLAGLIIGIPMVRLGHLGSGLVTFFFSFVVIVLLTGQQLLPLTQGENGIASQPAHVGALALDQNVGLYYFTWAALLLVSLVGMRYGASRAGSALKVLKRSESVASSSGINVAGAKLSAFVFSAGIAGFAGFIFGQSLGYLSPGTFSPNESIYLIAMVVVGGKGTITGPIMGSIFFIMLGQLTQSAGATQELLFALVLLAALVLLPGGFFGGIDSAIEFLSDRVGRKASTHPIDDGAVAIECPSSGEPPGTGSGERLTVSALGVHFGGVTALADVNFEVTSGAVHGVIGPNGAGKTTLLNCISGLQGFTGDVRLGARSIAQLPPRDVRRLGVCRTFQHPSLADDMSAQANVEIGCYGGAPRLAYLDLLPTPRNLRVEREAANAARRALDLVGFPPAHRATMAGDLGLAERKIIDIARAVAGSPSLLLLDEPTAGLEGSEMQRMADVIRTVHKSGVTVLVIAHHIGFLRSVATEATVLDFGRVLISGPIDDVTESDAVVSVFLGSVPEV